MIDKIKHYSALKTVGQGRKCFSGINIFCKIDTNTEEKILNIDTCSSQGRNSTRQPISEFAGGGLNRIVCLNKILFKLDFNKKEKFLKVKSDQINHPVTDT